MKDIQCYIASKTKIWIERSGIEYVKKSEEEENKKWYSKLAKDHFAYVGVYRKAIDELEYCKKELWSMMTDPEATDSEKVQMLRELHNLTKTSTLLLRDLPFISDLTKYYDLDFFGMDNNTEESKPNLSNNINSDIEEELIEQKVSERLKKMMYESALFKSTNEEKTISNHTIDSDNVQMDKVSRDMQKQLNPTVEDILDSINNKDYQVSIRKIMEIRED